MMAHGLARWIVALAALLVPRGRRSEWLREWRAELAHGARALTGRRLVRRSLHAWRDAASLRMGDAPRADSRSAGAGIDGIVADTRFALRMLRRSPGFTAVALLTFGLGIGVNATVFAAVDAVLFRPLPYAEPSSLVAVELEPGTTVSKSNLVELRARTSRFEALAGWSRWGFTWTGEGPAELITGARATADLFDVLGVAPAAGRLFEPGDDAPGVAPVAVVTYAFWQSRLGGDGAAVGRVLVLNGEAATVVGVLPGSFAFPDASAGVYLPAPLDPADESDYTAGYLDVVGRLRQGVDEATASADVRTAMRALHADRGRTSDYGESAQAVALRDRLVGSARAPLLALLAAVGFVLLVACANLANLLLARTTGRSDELAVRRALGASTGRVARQLLVESAVLALAGAVVGLVIARAGVELAAAWLPSALPGAGSVSLDARVVGAAVVAALFSGLAAGALPGLRGGRSSPAGALGRRGSTGGRSGLRVQGGLLAAEVALAVLLVASAGLALAMVRTLLHQETGFRTTGVVTVMALPPEVRYGDDARLETYWRDALDAVRGIDGVAAAGAIHLPPFGGGDWNPELVIDGSPPADGERRPAVGWRVITPGWFDAAGVPLLSGRDFDERDRADGIGVAIVNETLARRIWPDGSAIGHRIRTFFEGDEWVEIVGVVGDTRDVALDRALRPQMYRPLTQHPMGAMMVAARTDLPMPRSATALRDALERLDDDVPLTDLRPFGDRIRSSIERERLVARLLGGFATLALLLGAVGIYGVTAYAVGRRRRELGVRSALGARRADLAGLVLGGAIRPAGAGAAAGVLLALGAARVAATRIPDVPAPDPLLLLGAAGVLLAVALLAAWVPARRAARVDPQRTLRDD